MNNKQFKNYKIISIGFESTFRLIQRINRDDQISYQENQFEARKDQYIAHLIKTQYTEKELKRFYNEYILESYEG
jgi:hypothetical protein